MKKININDITWHDNPKSFNRFNKKVSKIPDGNNGICKRCDKIYPINDKYFPRIDGIRKMVCRSCIVKSLKEQKICKHMFDNDHISI